MDRSEHHFPSRPARGELSKRETRLACYAEYVRGRSLVASSLRQAMTLLLADTPKRPSLSRTAIIAANDNEEIKAREPKWPDDPMTLKEVQFELRLKEAQIVKLRRLWSFPAPVHHRGKLLFSRREVERWVRLQPNANNLAAVLRLHRRRQW